MKRINILISLVFIIALSTKAEVPYSKLFNTTKESLVEGKFKFDKKKNLWVLNKINGLNATANAMNGIVSPLKDDYWVWIFLTKEQQACAVKVEFYNVSIFDDLLTQVKIAGGEWIENTINGIKTYKTQIDGYDIELHSNYVSQQLKGSYGQSFDRSYHLFTYIIRNELEQHSPYLDKLKEKESKKAKKSSVDALM